MSEVSYSVRISVANTVGELSLGTSRDEAGCRGIGLRGEAAERSKRSSAGSHALPTPFNASVHLFVPAKCQTDPFRHYLLHYGVVVLLWVTGSRSAID